MRAACAPARAGGTRRPSLRAGEAPRAPGGARREDVARPTQTARGVQGRQGGSEQGADPKPSPGRCRPVSFLTRRAATADGKPCTTSTISLGRRKGVSLSQPRALAAGPLQSHPRAGSSFPASAELQAPPRPEGTPPAPDHLRPCLQPKYSPVPRPVLSLLRSTRPQRAHQDPYAGTQPGSPPPPQLAPSLSSAAEMPRAPPPRHAPPLRQAQSPPRTPRPCHSPGRYFSSGLCPAGSPSSGKSSSRHRSPPCLTKALARWSARPRLFCGPHCAAGPDEQG